MWLAHYKGSFSSTETGTFRMVGWGDNVLIVKVGSNLVLDASDIGYTGHKREAAGAVSFPKKGGTPMFHGQWFEWGPRAAFDYTFTKTFVATAPGLARTLGYYAWDDCTALDLNAAP